MDRKVGRRAASFVAFLVLAGCASSGGIGGALADGKFVEALGVPDRSNVSGTADAGYRLGPLDKVSIRVFGQKDLSIEKAQVDASGQIVMPLVGVLTVGGKTAQEASMEIAARLSERYLQSPSVSMTIDEAVSQRVTVTGAVAESGIYALKGRTSLLQALSMAKGPDQKYANLKQVVVFRMVDGRRSAALFDVAAIGVGKAEDPEIFGGDTIVVATSKSKTAWRELVSALPGIGAFAYF